MQIPCANRIRTDDESARRTLTRVVHGRISRVGIALLTAAALAAALAPCAQARGPRLGLVTAAYLMGDPGPTLSDARRAGARWTREDVAWYRVQPFPGVWDWRATDRLMAAAAHRQIHVLPLLLGSPCWAAPRGTRVDACARTLPADPTAFGRFAARAAARYGPHGHFWNAHPKLDRRVAPRWFEVWNEPEFAPPYASHGASPQQYAQLLRAAVRAGRRAAPQTRWL